LFVAFIVFIDMMGIGLILPVMPALIEGVTGATIDRAAEIGGWLIFAYAIMQFLFAPIIGGLSDRFGRRPVLLITLFLLGVDYAIMAWAPDLLWLFIGRVISGIMGASWAAANSCVADVTTPKDRGKYFGILGGAGAMGFVLGPGIGGVLGEYGPRLPFIAASVLALLGTAIGILILKETLPEEKRRRFTLTRANPLGSIIQMAKTPLVLGFLATIFVLQLAAQAQIAIWAYWLIERFEWSILQIGLSVAMFGILLAIVQGGLTGTVIARLGDRRTAMFGLLFGIPAYLIFAFAPSGIFVYVGIVVGAASGFAFPAMQQMMSNRIDESAQGELQGSIASTVSLTSVFGPVMMTAIFSAFADKTGFYFPGAPFIVGTGLMLVSFAIYLITVRRYYSPPV
jgi:DHA1 family tetracycline resistance protein-like MFS transporter